MSPSTTDPRTPDGDGRGRDAVDASMSQRPGVPMELDPPRAAGAAHWGTPERQTDPGFVLKREGLRQLTPVFGTAVPPRGLSGVLRRAAYAIPEHRTSHWLVLLLADRVDVLEHARRRRAIPVAAVLLGLIALRRARSRRGDP